MAKKLIGIPLLTAAVLMLSWEGGQTSYAAMTACAGVSWVEEDGLFRCYDKEGRLITSSWVRDSGQYYFIDENGYMMTDQLVEYDGYTYYVGADGARVKKQWVSVPNEPGREEVCGHGAATLWYYIGPTGRMYTDGKRTIAGKQYIFDEEGHMLSGWQRYEDESDFYYLGTEDEGWLHTGWQRLEPWYEMDGDYDTQEWFYFRPSNGKAFRDTKKQLDGHYYGFDENGVMKGGWLPNPDGGAAEGESSTEPAWFDEDTGKAWKGWIYACDPEDADEGGKQYWYYLDSQGIPFNRGGKDANSTSHAQSVIDNSFLENCAAKVIGGETYFFNDRGQMLTGYFSMWNVRREGGSDLGSSDWEYYYFYNLETKKEGRMMTGKQKIYDDGGDVIGHAHLKDNGRAYTTSIVGGRLYDPTGFRFDAPEDQYELLDLGSIDFRVQGSSLILTQCRIVIDDSGKVKKSGTVAIDGVRYRIEDYVVIGEEEIE